MPDDKFKAALTKLATDPEFRQGAVQNPQIIEQQFGLSVKELQALRQVAILSGADIRAVDAIRGSRIIARATAEINEQMTTEELDAAVSVSCCSCCCCCCGETAVIAV